MWGERGGTVGNVEREGGTVGNVGRGRGYSR